MASMMGDAGMCSTTTVPCDDLQLAMTGIPVGSLWVTRLRAILPASALSTDLVLEATSSQGSQAQVPSFHSTSNYTDPSYQPCPNGCDCRTSESPRSTAADAFLLGLGAVVVGLSLRRRRR
jgi:MYXO-CTERM domain-containing protein